MGVGSLVSGGATDDEYRWSQETHLILQPNRDEAVKCLARNNLHCGHGRQTG
jgi:hypothetical protein